MIYINSDKISKLPLKNDKTYDKVKKVKFGSTEFFIVGIIILIITAFGFYLTSQFVEDARQSKIASNEQVLYLSVFTVITTGDYTEGELDIFLKKYKTFVDIKYLINGESNLEKQVVSYLSASTRNLPEDISSIVQTTDKFKIPIDGDVQILYDGATLTVNLQK